MVERCGFLSTTQVLYDQEIDPKKAEVDKSLACLLICLPVSFSVSCLRASHVQRMCRSKVRDSGLVFSVVAID